jgi:hypothetical protein
LTYVPAIQRLVEQLCSHKHKAHTGYLSDILSIERLVKTCQKGKHTINAGNITDIPALYRLIYVVINFTMVRQFAEECSTHIFYLADIPAVHDAIFHSVAAKLKLITSIAFRNSSMKENENPHPLQQMLKT